MSGRIKYQASKSTSNKRPERRRDILSGLPHSEFLGIASTFSGLVLSLLFSLTIYNNTHASSISVSVSGDMNLDLLASNDGMFGTSSASSISVRSTNAAGYTLTLTGDRADGRLVGTDPNGNHYFTNIESSLTGEQFDTAANNGKWGIFPSKYNSVANTTNYYPAPTSTTPVNIDTTNSANNTPNTYTLAIAARAAIGADTHTPTDTYSGTMTLAATGNAIDYDIAYVDYDAGMPGLTHGASSNGKAPLSTATPTKPGYEFAGWCTVPVATGATCTGTSYSSGGDYTLNGSGDNNVTLYAIWTPITFDKAFIAAGKTDNDKVNGHFKMQDMTSSICNAVAIGQEGTLTDNRADKKTYTVGKLKDGRCWMLDNLALGGSSTIALTTSDTNISSNWTLPVSTSSINSYKSAQVNTDYINDVPSDSMSQAGGWKIGAYYNYCAASAGTYCPEENAIANVSRNDICPLRWRLPSGSENGQYGLTFDYYGNYTSLRNALHVSLAGHYTGNARYNVGNASFWWSNTLRGINNNYILYVNQTHFDSNNDSMRNNGFTMRCIAR